MGVIRFAELSDLPRLVEIYNQAIAAGNATGDTVPFTLHGRQPWFECHSQEAYPIYVFSENEGEVRGFLSLSAYRDRPAMRRTAEISYYVDYAHHYQGIGTALMDHALADCPRLGIHVLVAILLEWNQSSIKLLQKFGFEQWGYLPDVAEFSGRLCGHLYYGRKITWS
jgi:L-amino acid N-acyltransferase YncA